MVGIYWLNESLIAQSIEEKVNQQKEVLNKLEFMENKYDALIKAHWDLEVVIVVEASGDQPINQGCRKRLLKCRTCTTNTWKEVWNDWETPVDVPYGFS